MRIACQMCSVQTIIDSAINLILWFYEILQKLCLSTLYKTAHAPAKFKLGLQSVHCCRFATEYFLLLTLPVSSNFLTILCTSTVETSTLISVDVSTVLVHRIVKKFEETGSVSKRKYSVANRQQCTDYRPNLNFAGACAVLYNVLKHNFCKIS